MFVNERVDVRNRPLERLARKGLDLHNDLLTMAEPCEVLLVCIEPQPKLGQVCDAVDVGARLNVRTLIEHLLDDNASARRGKHHTVVCRAALFDFSHLLFGKPPEKELLSRRRVSVGVARGEKLTRFALCRLCAGFRGKQLLLCGQQVRAVEPNQVVAFADANARVVHVQAVDTTRNPSRDGADGRFVVVDLADHAHRARYVLAPHGLGNDACKLFGRW